MNVRYLCKKDFPFITTNKEDVLIQYGDIVQVCFDNNTVKMKSYVHNTETGKAEGVISDDELKSYFFLYDDIGALDPITAMTYFIHKFSAMSNQTDMLKDLKYYVKERKNFLNQ